MLHRLPLILAITYLKAVGGMVAKVRYVSIMFVTLLYGRWGGLC